MRKLIFAVCATFLIITGCGGSKDVLNLYTWSDYIDPELVKEFEKKYECRVVIDIFNSNEAMLAKIQAGADGYDIIFPSSYMIEIMKEKNLLEKIDKKRIPNLENIDPLYLNFAIDNTMEYGVPYMITYTGIAYRSDRVKDVAKSWSVFADRSDLLGRMTLLDDMRETIGAALAYKGYSVNTTNEAELAEARDIVIDWKKNIAKFENEQYKTGIAGSEFLLVHSYSGDVGQAQAEDPSIAFFLPKEGFSISCDEMVIPKTANNKNLAYKFIDFIHDGQIAARNMEYTTYWCPNIAAVEYLSEDIVTNPTVFPNPSEIERGEVIGDVGEALPLYTRIWDEIKAAR